MWYFIAFLIGAWILYLIINYIINYIRSYPERKRLRILNQWIKEILGGLDPKVEKRKIWTLLEENLPGEYLCRRKIRGGRMRCNGILLKYREGRYYCSECHNLRQMVKLKGD